MKLLGFKSESNSCQQGMGVESNLTVHSASQQGQLRGHTAAQACFSEMQFIPCVQRPLWVKDTWRVSEPSLTSVRLCFFFYRNVPGEENH